VELNPNLKFNFANASVLAIDPSVICLDVASSILSAYGFRKLYRCGDLGSATKILASNTIDLLLIDPYPFGDRGYDFVRRLRADTAGPNATVPVIIVAAYTHLRLITAMRECGADYVVAKPFSTGGLLERILWVATKEGRRNELTAPQTMMSQEGSGVDLW